MLIKSVLGMVFIAMLVWWTFAPSAGERELRLSQEALKHVTSWREEVPPESGFQEEMEVSCSNQSAHLVRSRIVSGGVNVMDEEARIGLSAYTRHSVRYEQTPANDITSDWQRGAYILPTLPCTALSRGGTAYFFPDYERLIHTALITRGEKDYIHGAVCKDWKARITTGRYQGAWSEDDVICIGVDDHLPYRVRKGSTTYILYDWNVPVAVDEPTVIERPRPSWQQAWPAVRADANTWTPREPEPPIHYLSPIPPPLPPPPVLPPSPPEDEDPR